MYSMRRRRAEQKRGVTHVTTALIGYTGFVGSNILGGRQFDDLYNSSNLDEIAGKKYDLVVSAANRADSFRINEHPDEDLAEIEAIAATISRASIAKLVLISTVCVYEASDRSDEDTPISTENLTPYGRNRFALEQLMRDRYDTTIIRLPQLFGPGLKKGVIYDLANNYRVEHIRPAGLFQYYDLQRLWDDIEVALEHNVPVLNVATPPLTSERVARECFGIDISGQVPIAPESAFSQMYTRNMTTKYAELFGREGDYLITEHEELEAITAFASTIGSRSEKTDEAES
jgi:nucleoside-diphosphate-sugar epimerase